MEPGPESVTGNTRVNVAFPFSKITVQEPSSELVELSTIVSDFITALAEWVPEDKLTRSKSVRKRSVSVS
jgi:hypothetical protein